MPKPALATLAKRCIAVLPRRARFGLEVRYAQRRTDPELGFLRAVLDRGDGFLDVGANTGVYSKAALLQRAWVVAYEPIPQLAESLERDLGPKAEVRCQAISPDSGVALLHIPTVAGRRINSRASLRQDANPGLTLMEVPVQVGPPATPNRPVVVAKVDVEGFEDQVIKALRPIIEQHCPTLIIEIEGRHHCDGQLNSFQLLQSAGYVTYFMRNADRRLLPYVQFDASRDQIPQGLSDRRHRKPSRYINNFIFVHESRLVALSERLQRGRWVIVNETSEPPT